MKWETLPNRLRIFWIRSWSSASFWTCLAIKHIRNILDDEKKSSTKDSAWKHSNTFPSFEEGFKSFIANYGVPSKYGRIDLDWMMTLIQFGSDAKNIEDNYNAQKNFWTPASYISGWLGGKEKGTVHKPHNDPNETRMIELIKNGTVEHFSDLWDGPFLDELEARLKKECCLSEALKESDYVALDSCGSCPLPWHGDRNRPPADCETDCPRATYDRW